MCDDSVNAHLAAASEAQPCHALLSFLLEPGYALAIVQHGHTLVGKRGRGSGEEHCGLPCARSLALLIFFRRALISGRRNWTDQKKVDVRKDSRSVAGSSSHPPPLPSSQKTFSLLMAGSKASTGLSAYAACWLSWGPPLARAGSWPWWALALACPACPLTLPLQPLLPFFLVFFVDAAQRPKLHPVERCYAAEWGKATQIYFGTAIRRLNTDRQQQP